MFKARALSAALLFSCTSMAQALGPAQQCAQDLCGPSKNFTRLSAQGDFGRLVSKETKAYFANKIDPLLNQAFESRQKLMQLNLAALDQNLDELLKDSSDSPIKALRLVKLSMILLLSSAQSEDFETTSKGSPRINLEKIKKRTSHLSADTVERLGQFLNTYFETDGSRTSMYFTSLDFDTLRLILTQGQTDEEALKKFSSIAIGFAFLASTYENSFGPLAFVGIDTGLAILTASKPTPTQYEKQNFVEWIGRVFSLGALLDPSMVELNKKTHLNAEDLAPLRAGSKNRVEFEQALNQKEKVDSAKNLARGTCYQTLNQALAASPSELRLRQTEKLIASVKTAAEKASARYFSGEALAKALTSIEEVRVMKPQGLAEIQINIESSLAGEHQKLTRLQEMLIENTKKQGNQTLVADLALTSIGQMDDKILSSKLVSACEALKPPSFVDKSIATAKLIQIGWQTTDFPEVGAGVFAHELGHIVSAAVEPLSSGNSLYEQTRSCSKDVHKNIKSSSKLPLIGNEEGYKEEDWADSFAATTLEELSQDWPHSENFACALIPVWENLGFLGTQLINPNANDSHSSGMLRALQQHISKGGQAPKSCEQAFGAEVMSAAAIKCGR